MGADTVEVLKRHGYSEEDIAAFLDSKVIRAEENQRTGHLLFKLP